MAFAFLEYRNHAVLTNYAGNARMVEVPAFHNGKPVTELGVRAFASSAVREVILPNSIEIIGMGCFENCYQLETIKTSATLRVIEYMAFAGSRLSVFECDTKELVLDAKAFSDTYSLKKFSLPKVKRLTLGDACFMRSNIEVFSAPAAQVNTIEGHTFAYCSSLKNVHLHFHSVQEFAFYCCRNLESLPIPEKLSNVDKTAFQGCQKLRLGNVNEVSAESLHVLQYLAKIYEGL